VACIHREENGGKGCEERKRKEIEEDKYSAAIENEIIEGIH
jgi:hypothetical protein